MISDKKDQRISTKPVAELFRKGIQCLRDGKALEALTYFDEVAVDCTTYPDLHFARATALIQIGKLGLAKEACQAELRLEPQHDYTKRLLGRIQEVVNEPTAYQTGKKVPRKKKTYYGLKGTEIGPDKYPQKREPTVADIIGTFKAENFVTINTKIGTIGSCFAQEIKRWLNDNGYKHLRDEWGIVYSPQTIRQIIQYSFEPNTWAPAEKFWIEDNNFYEPYRKANDHSGPAFLGNSTLESQQTLEQHYERSRNLLKDIEVMIITLGLTELVRNKEDKCAFDLFPWDGVYKPEIHEFWSLTYDEVMSELGTIVSLFRKHNPKAKIILTVSPVPLGSTFRGYLGPYIATSFSKSILHAASFEAVEENENVYYLPSYEIARSNPVKNYKEDGRHVNTECIDRIMEAFHKLYVKEQSPTHLGI